MKGDPKIFLVTAEDGKLRLVQSSNVNGVIKHLSAGSTIEVQSTVQVASLMEKGVKLERAAA